MPRIEAGRSPSRCRGRIDCQDRTGSGPPWAFLEPFLEPFQEPFQEMFDEGDDGRSRPPSPVRDRRHTRSVGLGWERLRRLLVASDRPPTTRREREIP